MGYLLLSLVLLSALLAYGAIYLVNRKARKTNIDFYLKYKTGSAIQRLNRVITRFGHRHQKDLEQKLVDAGVYNQQFAKYYLPAKMGLLLVTLAAITLSGMALDSMLLSGCFALVAILVIPDGMLAARKKALVLRTSRQLPYMLDMMAVCARGFHEHFLSISLGLTISNIR